MTRVSTYRELVDRVIRMVGAACFVEPAAIKGKTRVAGVVYARHIAMHVVREAYQLSYPQIGRLFERNHATVQHACKKVRGDSKMLNESYSVRRSLREPGGQS